MHGKTRQVEICTFKTPQSSDRFYVPEMSTKWEQIFSVQLEIMTSAQHQQPSAHSPTQAHSPTYQDYSKIKLNMPENRSSYWVWLAITFRAFMTNLSYSRVSSLS